jgi:hypothetical protein
MFGLHTSFLLSVFKNPTPTKTPTPNRQLFFQKKKRELEVEEESSHIIYAAGKSQFLNVVSDR